jgi:hypothetical protein
MKDNSQPKPSQPVRCTFIPLASDTFRLSSVALHTPFLNARDICEYPACQTSTYIKFEVVTAVIIKDVMLQNLMKVNQNFR